MVFDNIQISIRSERYHSLNVIIITQYYFNVSALMTKHMLTETY